MRGHRRAGDRKSGRSGENYLPPSPTRPIPLSALRAFTLLELVLALLLIALLVGMVFATARSSLMLGNSVIKTQNEEMLHQAFFELLKNRFAALPGNTRLELAVTDAPSHYISDLTLQNVPISFTWGGEERTAKAIQLATVLRRSGFLDIVLRYYENEIIDPQSGDSSGSGFSSSAIDSEPFAEITLLTDVRYFEWRALDGRTMEYQYDWDLPGRLPLQLELLCAFGADGETIRQVFWIPPRQNPEVFMRQLQQGLGTGNSGNPSTDGGNPSSRNTDGTPIEITPGSRPPGGQPPGNTQPSGSR